MLNLLLILFWKLSQTSQVGEDVHAQKLLSMFSVGYYYYFAIIKLNVIFVILLRNHCTNVAKYTMIALFYIILCMALNIVPMFIYYFLFGIVCCTIFPFFTFFGAFDMLTRFVHCCSESVCQFCLRPSLYNFCTCRRQIYSVNFVITSIF